MTHFISVWGIGLNYTYRIRGMVVTWYHKIGCNGSSTNKTTEHAPLWFYHGPNGIINGRREKF